MRISDWSSDVCSSDLTAATADGSFAPNAFIRVAPDNTDTVLIKHIEMGQGTFTGLATLVAEEMDADWRQIRAEHAPADASRSEERRGGKGGVSSGRSRWWPNPKKKKKTTQTK